MDIWIVTIILIVTLCLLISERIPMDLTAIAIMVALMISGILMGLSISDACGLRDIYRPRNPRAGAYYQCAESHFEELEQVWDDRSAPRFGFWRPYITDGREKALMH